MRPDLRDVEHSREGGRLWLLVIVFTVMGLALLTTAVSRSLAASADLMSQTQVRR